MISCYKDFLSYKYTYIMYVQFLKHENIYNFHLYGCGGLVDQSNKGQWDSLFPHTFYAC